MRPASCGMRTATPSARLQGGFLPPSPFCPPPPQGAMNVVGQLFQFIRFGFDGYAEVNRRMQLTTQSRAHAPA